ncbi:hypothetical protein IFM12276_28510 [Nocardia sputorum]|uniref:Uncharacterized protein n=1 Tax=Nocardia sputorum TaxID=2984338 RepID=A0ABM8CXV1_9NOCA|nr:hypothetical protein IFM12276_28510 [Nocardia sputorum]
MSLPPSDFPLSEDLFEPGTIITCRSLIESYVEKCLGVRAWPHSAQARAPIDDCRGLDAEQYREVTYRAPHRLLERRRLEPGPLPSPDHCPTYVTSSDLGKRSRQRNASRFPPKPPASDLVTTSPSVPDQAIGSLTVAWPYCTPCEPVEHTR